MKHIVIVEVRRIPDKVTRMWAVKAILGGGPLLGLVKWYSPWRRYVFEPCQQTLFEQDCLRDIAEFVERETRDHKKAARLRKEEAAV